MTYNIGWSRLLSFYPGLHNYQVEELGFEPRQSGVYAAALLKGSRRKHEFKTLAPRQKLQFLLNRRLFRECYAYSIYPHLVPWKVSPDAIPVVLSLRFPLTFEPLF